MTKKMDKILSNICNIEPLRAYIFDRVCKFELTKNRKSDDIYRLCNVELRLLADTIQHSTTLHYQVVANLTFFNCVNDEIHATMTYMDNIWRYCVPYKEDDRIKGFMFQSVVDDLNKVGM